MGLGKFIQLEPFVDAAGRLLVNPLRVLNSLIGLAEGTAATYAIEASYPSGFTSPLIQADNLGNVTIANHSRTYGDGTTVAVTGDTLATGEAPGAIVRVYYDDPSKSGGAVTYAWTVDPASAPIQSGNRVVVGRVEIPVVGTQDGTYLRPPGYLEP